MALLYNVGLRILLLHLVINIAISIFSLFGTFFATVDLLFFNNIVLSVEIIFLGFLLGLGSLADAFFFNNGILSKGHLVNNFVPCSDLSIYSLLVINICFVCRSQIQRCFNILQLYSIKILFQTF